MNDINENMRRVFQGEFLDKSIPEPLITQSIVNKKLGFKIPLLKIVIAASLLLIVVFLSDQLQHLSQYQELWLSETQNSENNNAETILGTQKENLDLPVRLIIPKINVNSEIEYVGVTTEGEMAVPYNISNVGWFAFGPPPGWQGSSVIAGHSDGESGETGVFSNLHKLEKGDTFSVENRKGLIIPFIVRESRVYNPGFAAEVFTENTKAHLNLITCDGIWNKTKRTYNKRLVVFADKLE